jgi:hypothetical protein
MVLFSVASLQFLAILLLDTPPGKIYDDFPFQTS